MAGLRYVGSSFLVLCMAGVYLYCFIQVYKSFIYNLLLLRLILNTCCYCFMAQFKLLRSCLDSLIRPPDKSV